MSKKLKVYELRYVELSSKKSSSVSKGWMLFTSSGHMVWPRLRSTRKLALECAKDELWLMWFYLGQRSELEIRNKLGLYSPARTYGPDPKKSKG